VKNGVKSAGKGNEVQGEKKLSARQITFVTTNREYGLRTGAEGGFLITGGVQKKKSVRNGNFRDLGKEGGGGGRMQGVGEIIMLAAKKPVIEI